jgi:beta-lactam-binding protein with PASTA domain
LSIISQDPPSGSKVKSGRSIYVVINRKEPPPTQVPYIEEGTSYLSVVEILESRGLKVGNVSYKPFQYKDVFLSMSVSGQLLKHGTTIPKGTVVDLVLGNGLGDTKVQIPDLTGLSYLEGASLIALKELNLGSVIPEGVITDTLEAFIIRQFPAPGDDQYINMGSMIDIWISDTEPEYNFVLEDDSIL